MIINLYWAIKLLMYKIVHVAQLAQLRWSSAHKYSLSHCMWFYSTLNIYWYFNYKHALSRLVMQWQLFRERLISQLLDLTWEVITWHKYILQWYFSLDCRIAVRMVTIDFLTFLLEKHDLVQIYISPCLPPLISNESCTFSLFQEHQPMCLALLVNLNTCLRQQQLESQYRHPRYEWRQ